MTKIDDFYEFTICTGCYRICINFHEFDAHKRYKNWALGERQHEWQWLKNYVRR